MNLHKNIDDKRKRRPKKDSSFSIGKFSSHFKTIYYLIFLAIRPLAYVHIGLTHFR